jgi:hypothetical protein
MPGADLLAAMRLLYEGGVDFIVVGGVAAVLNGAPVSTFDLDIVPARDKANIDRLLEVLQSAHATYRLQPDRRLVPTADHLRTAGHHNLATDYGALDVLGTIGRGLGYEDLLPHTVEIDVGNGVRVRVLDLATIVQMKEELGDDKDRAALPILRQVLKVRSEREH